MKAKFVQIFLSFTLHFYLIESVPFIKQRKKNLVLISVVIFFFFAFNLKCRTRTEHYNSKNLCTVYCFHQMFAWVADDETRARVNNTIIILLLFNHLIDFSCCFLEQILTHCFLYFISFPFHSDSMFDWTIEFFLFVSFSLIVIPSIKFETS